MSSFGDELTHNAWNSNSNTHDRAALSNSSNVVQGHGPRPIEDDWEEQNSRKVRVVAHDKTKDLQQNLESLKYSNELTHFVARKKIESRDSQNMHLQNTLITQTQVAAKTKKALEDTQQELQHWRNEALQLVSHVQGLKEQISRREEESVADKALLTALQKNEVEISKAMSYQQKELSEMKEQLAMLLSQPQTQDSVTDSEPVRPSIPPDPRTRTPFSSSAEAFGLPKKLAVRIDDVPSILPHADADTRRLAPREPFGASTVDSDSDGMSDAENSLKPHANRKPYTRLYPTLSKDMSSGFTPKPSVPYVEPYQQIDEDVPMDDSSVIHVAPKRTHPLASYHNRFTRQSAERTMLVGFSNEDDNDTADRDSNDEGDVQGPDGNRSFASLHPQFARQIVQETLEAMGIRIEPNKTHALPPRKNLNNSRIRMSSKQPECRETRLEFLALVRAVFKEKLAITQDEDFISHTAADFRRVAAYNSNPVPGSGPDIENVQFDLGKEIKTSWNLVLFEHLCDCIDQRRTADGILPERSRQYYLELVVNRFKLLKGLWTKAQPQSLSDGGQETLEEAEERYIKAGVFRRDAARRLSRQLTKFNARVVIVDKMIKIKKDANDSDLEIWEWFRDVLRIYGKNSMSSESSGDDEGGQTVYRVKILYWRRDIRYFLDLIDKERFSGNTHSNRGSKPGRRVEGVDISDRDPAGGLPECFYDAGWLATKDEEYLTSVLHVSKTQFRWLDHIEKKRVAKKNKRSKTRPIY